MKLDRVNLSYWKDENGEYVEGAINYYDVNGNLLHVHINDDSTVMTNGKVDWGKVVSFLKGKGIDIEEKEMKQ